ncbi:phage tail assembly chaperone [Alphaproteobacteria bacterium]|nr:phage tail assembly chaperone [Alphaproteobacteria bacterium]
MPQVTITEVRNAQSLNAENTAFEVEINHPEHGWIPYGLMPDDPDTTVDNSVLLGLIGSDYAAYVAPTQAELDAELADSLRVERDQKLVEEVDPIVTNPLRWAELTEAKQAEWTQYRTDLLNLPAQAGFPNTVTWPTKPT